MSHEYVLGTHQAEAVRLGFQHRVWGAVTSALWERATFSPGQTIVDLGCGPGFASVDLIHLVGATGKVIAVDLSPEYLELLRARLTEAEAAVVELRQGDAARLDLPPASVDRVFTRWVLSFVPDPDAAIAAVARALKPGGIFAVQDWFNYRAVALAPRSPVVDQVVAAIEKSWRARGGDPDIMARVPALCRRHGLRVSELRPELKVARPRSTLWRWTEAFMTNYVPVLASAGLISDEVRALYEREWALRSEDPDTFLALPPLFELTAVKES